mmetsp:Transcript_44041/g.103726  ORF Transcript_44041/g.103726 Transcript_44041/m.103726 type:complete len:281 (+) Transcript_44041:233-1075(+)
MFMVCDHHLVRDLALSARVHDLSAQVAVHQLARPANKLGPPACRLRSGPALPRRARAEEPADRVRDRELGVDVDGGGVTEARVRRDLVGGGSDGGTPEEPDAAVVVHLEVQHHARDMRRVALQVQLVSAVVHDALADALDLGPEQRVGDGERVREVLAALEGHDALVHAVLLVRHVDPVRTPLHVEHVRRPDRPEQRVPVPLAVHKPLQNPVVLLLVVVQEVPQPVDVEVLDRRLHPERRLLARDVVRHHLVVRRRGLAAQRLLYFDVAEIALVLHLDAP